MEQTDKLFANKGWIVAKNIDGKIKVSTENHNETYSNIASMHDDNWITLNNTNTDSTHFSETESRITQEKNRQIKSTYKEITREYVLTGFCLIRDLLNLQKPNGLAKIFLVDGMPVQSVAVCARISSVDLKNQYYRLVIDDGTSAILCMVKKVDQDNTEQASEETVIDKSGSSLHLIHPNTSSLLQRIELHSNKLRSKMKPDFDQSSLGLPIMVMGHLQEFREKNFIFANHVRRVTEDYYVKFMSYIIQSYEHKENFMFD